IRKVRIFPVVIARLRILFLLLGLVAPAGAAGAAAGGNGEPLGDILVSRGLMRERGLSVGQVVMLCADAPGAGARPCRIAGDDEHFVIIERFHMAISVVTMIGSTAFLLALMVIRADERREIAGLLRLLGLRRRRILLQALLEGLCIATAGAVFGVLFAAVT